MFNVATLNRAKPYSSEKLIRDLTIEKTGVSQGMMIRCKVNGTSVSPYRLSMYIQHVESLWHLRFPMNSVTG